MSRSPGSLFVLLVPTPAAPTPPHAGVCVCVRVCVSWCPAVPLWCPASYGRCPSVLSGHCRLLLHPSTPPPPPPPPPSPVNSAFLPLQVISLEGWVDIMYYVQDAHSFWDWIYFVLLIVVSKLVSRVCFLFLQVISLAGWVNIMYFVQDAHSFWDWTYFVSLIVVSLVGLA